MDPAKLKVVELRAELQARGLDTKGNKPVLVKRLKEALETELDTDLPDTSIADTSTEDFGSQDDDCMVQDSLVAKEADPEDGTNAELELPLVTASEVKKPVEQSETESIAEDSKGEPEAEPDTPELVQESKIEVAQEPTTEPVPECTTESVEDELMDTESAKIEEPVAAEVAPQAEQSVTEEAEQKADESVATDKVEQNGDNTNGETEEDSCEPKAKKSRWGNESEAVVTDSLESTPAVGETEFKEQKDEQETQQPQQRADKRKHSSPSPERNQRQRSKSPIREDEPVVDANKVQLSWYDSDLHLQIDKTNFLSAKPLNDGLFGYIWSGARLTHGIKSGKACFEIKITEELKFDDILTSSDRPRDNRRDRRDRRAATFRAKSENGSERSDKTNKSEPKQTDDNTVDKEKKEKDVENVSKDKAIESEQKQPPASIEEPPASTEEPPASTEEPPASTEKPEEVPSIPVEETEEKPKEEAETTEVTNEDAPATTEDTENAKEEKPDEKTTDGDDISKASKESKPEEKEKEKVELIKVPSHLIRIGWSHMKSSLQLGEDKLSYGLESTGKFYINKTVVSTDASFKSGDVVRAFVDFDKRELAFAINGCIAFTHQFELDDVEDIQGFALFPHVLTRNYAFEINAGEKEEAMSGTPEGYEDFVFVCKVDEKVNGVKSPEKREDCEVIMMCGLPGSGKTHWVEDYIKTTEKDFNIIGSSFLMERMTVDCKPISSSIGSDRMSFFWNKLQKSISRLCDIAPLRRRDFILDQTNVFPTAIRRKMRSFLGFKRHAVIVVNEDEEQEKRMKQQDPETGKDMSMSALLEMKANMALPKVGDNLEQATYVSLPEDKALEQVQKYNKQGRDGGFGNIGGHHRRDYRDDRSNRWHQRGSGGGGGGGPRRDYHPRNNYRDRPYPNNRYDRNYRQGSGGGGGGSSGNWRPSGGGSSGGSSGTGSWMSRNDRRDNRGPRDWRNSHRSSGMSERPQHRGGGNRDHRSHSSSNSSGSYNRNRNQSGGSSGGGGSGGGRWGSSSGGWNSQGGGGSSSGNWSGSQSQDWNSGWNQSQGSWNQNQWKYGGGYNQGGYSQYPQNWNSGYYGGSNYAQDWSGSNSGHGQNQSSASTTSATTNTTNTNSSQYSSSSPMIASQQQQAWAQYAQYPQGTTSNTGSSQK